MGRIRAVSIKYGILFQSVIWTSSAIDGGGVLLYLGKSFLLEEVWVSLRICMVLLGYGLRIRLRARPLFYLRDVCNHEFVRFSLGSILFYK